MNLITTIKTQLCYPCNKNLCFIKMRQIPNYKVHHLENTASGFLYNNNNIIIILMLVGSYMHGFTVSPLSSIQENSIISTHEVLKELLLFTFLELFLANAIEKLKFSRRNDNW